MSLRHRPMQLPLVNPFVRKLSGPVDRGWGDTFIGPIETPRPPDGREPEPTVTPVPRPGGVNGR